MPRVQRVNEGICKQNFGLHGAGLCIDPPFLYVDVDASMSQTAHGLMLVRACMIMHWRRHIEGRIAIKETYRL